eukprot:CAMPEP_0113312070 /NCGR_PEP_ID=MMETSP0010_2-20120614/9042_1 /TAXON_ID=216773 ORGANISM="Corethron hystrix, Strain 308" /NCGR_SAMPLE_ID=MMETSP0010_2 /ASSEMBLY_ACC=CAM_ASM_000155 /LENGTH=597 /DNA_ID=CAMNT_0000167811 /DNA_START=90 /DNA_END=1880 /DNA_ORIENTATION=- /assembly_acc=CAM_ASM_000155
MPVFTICEPDGRSLKRTARRARGRKSGGAAVDRPRRLRISIFAALLFVRATPSSAAIKFSFGEDDSSDESSGDGDEEEMSFEKLTKALSPSPPRGILSGLGSALVCVITGGTTGFTALLGLPIAGAVKGGPLGFFAGVVSGVLGGVILGASGFFVGAYQVGMGAYNSLYRSLVARRKCRVWDEKTGKWILYRIDVEAEKWGRLKEESDDGDSASSFSKSDRKVADRSYYDLLGVRTGATASQIKKGYYKEARIHHPDKNPDDADAAEKFRDISTAYRTLSDPNLRASYDRNGGNIKDDANNLDIDPKIFFAVMFGSHLVEKYIGTLWISSIVDSIVGFSKMSDSIDYFDWKDEAKERQRKREMSIAVNLRERVADYVSGEVSEQEFLSKCREEAEKIAETAFGARFLISIGSVIKLETDEYLGFYYVPFISWTGHRANFQRMRRGFRSFITLGRVGLKALIAGKDALITRDEDTEELKVREDLKVGLEESLTAILDLAWAFNVRDITRTVKGACERLFMDAGVTAQERVKRAWALRILAKEFLFVGKAECEGGDPNSNEDFIKNRAKMGAFKTMMKAQGQDLSDEEAEEMMENVDIW